MILENEVVSKMPPLKVEKPNREYAKILMQNYAGTACALSRQLTYFYQTLILKDSMEDLKATLKTCLDMKQKHMEAVGTLIHLLGEKPVYGTYDSHIDRIIPYTTCALSYETTPSIFLEQDIAQEKMMTKHYQSHQKTIQDAYIQDVLAWMIQGQEQLIAQLEKMSASYPKEKSLS